MKPPLRIALLGVGRFGRRLLPELSPRFDVVLCCSRGGRDTEEWLSRHHPGLDYTTSLERVFEDSTIGAVVIATPIETHAAIAAAALASGKHVLVEKPLATSAAEGRALAAQARGRDLVLFVSHQYLYHPAFIRLRAETGNAVTFARLSWRKLGTFDSDLFWNLASHDVSLALALVGEAPAEVELLLAQPVVSSCDIALVRLVFPGDRCVVIDIDRASPHRAKILTAVCADRTLVWEGGSLFEIGAGGEATELLHVSSDALGLQLDAFAAAVDRRAPFPSDAAHGAAVVEVVERIRSLLPEAA